MPDSAESDEGVVRSVREGDTADSVLDLLRDWYHVPALLAVFVVMLAIRLQSYDRFLRGGEVLFSGNDAWYHLREVRYTVRNWPTTMPFDPWTYFPYGTSVGQFGTLYDQLVATAALIVGLGSPGDTLVAKALLVAPAIFGALAVIPAYLIGKRLAGRLPGLFGAALLALLPGMFLQRTVVGVADHNGAEPFFMGMAVVALLGAFAVSEREKPIWELVAGREVDALRSSLLWGGLAGVATALYMWVWPPGVLLVGIVGIYLVLKICSDVVNEESPEPVAFAGATAMSVTAIMMLVPLQSLGFAPTQFSLIQPLLAFAVAAGSVFLAWLARQWEARDLDPTLYPVAVFGIVVVGLIGLWAVARPVWRTVANNLLRTVGFSAGAQTRTIAEAQPYLSPGSLRQLGFVDASGNPDRLARIVSDYGFTFFTAIIGAIWLLAKPLVREGRDGDTRKLGYVVGSLGVVALLFLAPGIPAAIGGGLGVDSSLISLAVVTALLVGAVLLTRHRADLLFALVWTAFITSAAFTQTRFHYYLVIPVVVLNAFLLGELLSYLDLRSIPSRLDDVDGYQVAVLVAVVMLIAAPVLMVPVGVRATGNPQLDKSSTAWQAAQTGPGAVTKWEGSLAWLNASTPAEGNFGGASNQGSLDYYGTYSDTDDFAYPEGSYGVMSWWDYGHWITVEGNRIPNANPFQQGATGAANFLLAATEEDARETLTDMSTEGNQTRYVMVDWQMATPGSKFGAPIVFYDAGNLSRSDMYSRVYQINDQQRRVSGTFLVRHQRYYESLMVRLYEYHGSAMQPQPVVVDWEETGSTTGGTLLRTPRGNESVMKTGFDNMSAARQYVQRDGSSQIGGIGPYPQERVPALQHYRLLKVSDSSATESGSYANEYTSTIRATGVPYRALTATTHQWLKTFERVPGATVEGGGAPANATVTASVQLRVPTTNSTFTYTQRARADEDGEFAMTLPYSTTGYDEYGPENGYTNVSVRATGPYTLRTSASMNESGYVVSHGANVTVDEGLVNGDQDGSKEVTLQRRAQKLQIQKSDGSGDSSGDSSDGSADNATADVRPSLNPVGGPAVGPDAAGGSAGASAGAVDRSGDAPVRMTDAIARDVRTAVQR
jgi:dolichyl-diphosphooligosaccharide--protein glycosyltransferase